jgi:serine-type D-Ala-D-Ala carboxypeptidase/endopeptidase (penicillin-binding protein 4)
LSPALAFGLAAAVAAAAAPATPRKARAPASLRTRVERALSRVAQQQGLKHALWAVHVRSLPSGKPLYSRQAELSVMPASSMKLATTAAALDAFGPDASFSTTVQAAARPNAVGHLPGDVYLVGSGDPSLSRELAARPDFGVFEILAQSLHDAGVRRIEGKVLGVDGAFAGERRGADWSWEDLVWWYGAEVSALTFADGAANLKIMPGAAAGEALTIERHPPSAYYKVESKATTCAAVDPPGLTLTRRFGRNVVELGGCLPPSSAPLERWVALEDPALYATTVFSEALAARGISVAGGVGMAPAAPEGLTTLAAYAGAPMKEILKDVNKPSHNLRAEMLLRLLGVRAKSEGSAAAGREAVLAFLQAHAIDTGGWDVLDGSGLSRSDLVTARGMADVLVAMNKHPHAAVFRDSLPVSGVDGTLKRRLSGPKARERIQAKTGTLRHTSALAGYATPARGDRLAFAIVVNHATATPAEIQDAVDAVAEAILGS